MCLEVAMDLTQPTIMQKIIDEGIAGLFLVLFIQQSLFLPGYSPSCC